MAFHISGFLQQMVSGTKSSESASTESAAAENAGQTEQTAQVNTINAKYLASLLAGDTVTGVVNSMKDNQVILSLPNGENLFARLAQGAQVQLGQSMTFQVQENKGNFVALKPLFGDAQQMVLVQKALEAAGLSANESNMAIVQELLARNMSIDAAMLNEMVKNNLKFPNASLDTMANLVKLNIPVTQENIEQYEAYTHYERNMAGQLDSLPSALSDTLTQLTGQDQVQAGTFLKNVTAALYEGLPQEMQAGLSEIMPQDAVREGLAQKITETFNDTPQGGQAQALAETDLEKAEFGDGVMVLPVSYTKGLEFDAVLLFDPTQEKYPSDNGHVKLLYVASTRALHELAVLHRGKLTGILADKVPEGKHMKEFAAETLTKAAEFERVQHTEKEIEQQRRIEGAKDMAEREYIGPKRIVIKPQGKENEAEARGKTLTGQKMASAYKRAVAAPVRKAADNSGKNEKNHTEEIIISPYEFGAIPDNAILRVKGHSRNNFVIKWIKKTKSYVELSSMYGLLRITPITPEVIRVSFVKGVTEKIGDTAWKGKADTAFSWSAKESKTLVEIATEKVTVRIAKNNGAVCFYNEKKQLLLAEKAEEPRFQEGGCNWTFFEWEKSEHLKAKGLLAADFMDVTAKAKYISHGGKKLRMPLVISEK